MGPTHFPRSPSRGADVPGVAALAALVPLHTLRAGDEGRIREIEGEPAFVHRLAEMGLRAGTPIRMVRPGTPCIVLINGHRLSLRADDAALLVFVELTAAG
ncbi:MAG: ferrous iron transport protein A [Planctomycetes bacterium]|nr:ferrous iron transport protein A [Planctomycetota bacterium]